MGPSRNAERLQACCAAQSFVAVQRERTVLDEREVEVPQTGYRRDLGESRVGESILAAEPQRIEIATLRERADLVTGAADLGAPDTRGRGDCRGGVLVGLRRHSIAGTRSRDR